MTFLLSLGFVSLATASDWQDKYPSVYEYYILESNGKLWLDDFTTILPDCGLDSEAFIQMRYEQLLIYVDELMEARISVTAAKEIINFDKAFINGIVDFFYDCEGKSLHDETRYYYNNLALETAKKIVSDLEE